MYKITSRRLTKKIYEKNAKLIIFSNLSTQKESEKNIAKGEIKSKQQWNKRFFIRMQEDITDYKKTIKIVKKSNRINKLKIAKQTNQDSKYLKNENLRKNIKQ